MAHGVRSKLPSEVCRHDNRQAALLAAKVNEQRTGKRHYVERSIGCWVVTTRMPLLGEWYDADGIRHG